MASGFQNPVVWERCFNFISPKWQLHLHEQARVADFGPNVTFELLRKVCMWSDGLVFH